MRNYRYLVFLLCLLLYACDSGVEPATTVPDDIVLDEAFYVHIDLNDRLDDTFKVEMFVDGLGPANAIIQFAATVPGTYSIADAGRFVHHLEVYDRDNQLVTTEKMSTNQWKINAPEQAYKITYQVSETFDTPVNSHPIYAMAGTSIEEDHVLLNAPMVIGYPVGLKQRDYFISLDYPESWSVGTALPEYKTNVFQATDFDHLADTPILLGDITSASTVVGSADIHVHVYSAAHWLQASQVLDDVTQILIDAKAFLKDLPTDQYDFIYHFGDVNAGALEHSKSSVYVLLDRPYSPINGAGVNSISAHEFFHVVTPLNIHSEIIADFNFAEPTPSQHLWLYEGVTEWASDFMQFRNGSMTLYGLLGELQRKVIYDLKFSNPNFSLIDISTQSYTSAGGSQFGNIYNRGALVASLLDIRLLELSGGQKGMRELILELIETFGPDHSFSETGFFDTIVAMTYPEIEDFINHYIKGTTSLPLAVYYEKIGIAYDEADYSFTPIATPSAAQQALYEAWAYNLPL